MTHSRPSPVAATLLVLAKAPIAGLAKTRLTPPLTPRDAARVAAVSLLDTLESMSRSPVAHHVVAFTGALADAEYADEVDRALTDFEVIPQRGASFGERLANAHADAARYGLPVLQIGMDTPQIGPDVLTWAARELVLRGDALLGPADDGGWWALGLPTPQAARTLVEVPMSTDRTGELTRDAMLHCDLRVRQLPHYNDVDTFADAVAVAAASDGRFARLVQQLHRCVLAPR
ncbi:TIGR04282 family arsenosugar biosynthesis glycosyltransferase [Nocardia sp. CA-107356]|uniref:TIGR04282 family arsenosugar biosynthesis glycosyltransferase n=1 Tax=Nocardia sp. CA-107356 TaxID=3239972 RepID=UPI003D925A8C